VLDAGCGIGLLVEALRERGVEAWGVDISEYAITHVPESVRPYCRLGSVTEELEDDYDVIAYIEVAEHLPAELGKQAIENLTAHTACVLFSSTPDDFQEPSHVNVQPIHYWVELFRRHDFAPDPTVDASFISPHAVCLRRISTREDRLRAMLADAQAQLLERDEVIRTLRVAELRERDQLIAKQHEAIEWLEGILEEREREIEWRRQLTAEQEEKSESLARKLTQEMKRAREREEALRDLEETTVVRLGRRYWRLRERLRGRSAG